MEDSYGEYTYSEETNEDELPITRPWWDDRAISIDPLVSLLAAGDGEVGDAGEPEPPLWMVDIQKDVYSNWVEETKKEQAACLKTESWSRGEG